MNVNIDIPFLRRRAQFEVHKIGDAADRLGSAAGRTADDATSRLSGLRLPSLDLGGAVKSARRTVDDARRAINESGEAVASGAEQAAIKAGHVGRDVGSAIDDLRHLRVTRERPRRDPWPGVALATGVAAGIAAMFLFDPRDGRRRRAVVRDKLGKWGRVAGREVRGTALDLRNRGQGVLHEARSALNREEQEQPGQADVHPGSGATIGRQPVGVAVGEPAEPQISQPSDPQIGEPTEPQISQPAGEGEAASPVPTGSGVFSDWSHEPGRPNGRETTG